MSSQTYTLYEAQLELARQECASHGHSWSVIEAYGKGPVSIFCDNCGASYGVDNPHGGDHDHDS